jgi:hypothetical protein
MGLFLPLAGGLMALSIIVLFIVVVIGSLIGGGLTFALLHKNMDQFVETWMTITFLITFGVIVIFIFSL